MKKTLKYNVILAMLLVSCVNNETKKTGLTKFNSSIQNKLTRVVNGGIFKTDSVTMDLQMTASDQELGEMIDLDIPIARLTAYQEIFNRMTVDHQDILNKGLRDTAVIPVLTKETGIEFCQIGDKILAYARWEDSAQFRKTLLQVLEHFQNLKAGYSKLPQLAPSKEYYPFVKQMANRKISTNEIGKVSYEDIEYALYALSKYGNPDDIPEIKRVLLENTYRFSLASFRAIEVSQSDQYIDVLKKFYKNDFNRVLEKQNDYYVIGAFFDALFSLENKENYSIANSILNEKTKSACAFDKDELFYEIRRSLIDNPYPMYANILKRIGRQAEFTYIAPVTPRKDSADTPTASEIRW